MEELSLKKLVGWSVANNIAPKNFISLFGQFVKRQPIDDNEYSTIVLLDDKTNSVLFTEKKRNLVISLSLSSVEQLGKFWTNFSKNDEEGEEQYLIKLNKHLGMHLSKISKDVVGEFASKQFRDYTRNLIDQCQKNDGLTKHQTTLLNQTVSIWVSLTSYSRNLDATLLHDLKSLLADKRLINLSNYLSSKCQSLSKGDDSCSSKFVLDDEKQRGTNKMRFKHISLNNLSSKNFRHIAFIKKYIWFSSTIKRWKFHDNDRLLNNYVNTFHSSDVRSSILVTDLICSIFRSIVLEYDSKETPTVMFVWRNFVVTRLPLILSTINLTSEKEKANLEDCIIDAFGSIEGPIADTFNNMEFGSHISYDLRHAFVKSCINRELLPVQSFFKVFPTDIKINQQTLIHDLNQYKGPISISEHLDEKLLSINCEFTSLEESGLIEFMNSSPKLLEFQSDAQLELGSIVSKVMDDLIYEKSHAKLGRLLLSIVNNFDVLNLIVFNLENGPYTILYKLINYIDSEDFNADEDDNFQDLYSYFGITLLSIILVCRTYDIDLSKLSIRESYTVDYLRNLYYGLCDNLTNREHDATDEEKEIISNYNSLLSEWINALFDDANEGLSDELIKSIKVKHIYKMIPLIYQQAIVAYNSGLIDLSIVSNGIDYLTQAFLIPCNSFIIIWLLRNINTRKDDLQSTWVKALFEIVKSTIGNNFSQDNETSSVTKLVYNIAGEVLIQTLEGLSSSGKNDEVDEMSGKIKKIVDSRFLTIKSRKGKSESALSVYQDFKAEFLNVTNGRGDFILVNQVRDMGEPELIRFLLEEIIGYQTNPTEDSKIFLHLVAYMISVDSVDSNADIEYWMGQLSSSSPTSDEKPHLTPGTRASDTFKFSMSHHYSSIFDEISSTKNEDEDNLFSDESKASTSPKLEEYKSRANRVNSILRFLQPYRERASNRDSSNLSDSLIVLNSILRENLQSLTI